MKSAADIVYWTCTVRPDRTGSGMQEAALRCRQGGGRTLLYYGYVFARLVSAILPISASYWVAERVADLWYLLSRGVRDNLGYNLALLPSVGADPRKVRKVSRAIMRNFARMVTEFLYMPRISPANLERHVDVESFAKLKRVLGRGTAIFVTAHLGNWELGAAVASMMGVDLHVVVYDHPDTRIARLFRQRRQAKGLKVMSLREAARRMRVAIAHSSVGVVGDRDFTGQGTETTFFGVAATVPYAYAAQAVASGIPIIPAFCVRLDDGRYHLMLEEPLFTPGSPETAAIIAERFVKVLEKWVEKHTEQWYFFQRVGERARAYV